MVQTSGIVPLLSVVVRQQKEIRQGNLSRNVHHVGWPSPSLPVSMLSYRF
jgi:hypothetical protein